MNDPTPTPALATTRSRGTPTPELPAPLSGRGPHAPGWRFDDTVALPTDAPARLAEIIREAGHALRGLPPTSLLSHRTVRLRAQLQRTLRDATEARARLAAGTYGTCMSCWLPISLAALTDKPWTRLCTACALGF